MEVLVSVVVVAVFFGLPLAVSAAFNYLPELRSASHPSLVNEGNEPDAEPTEEPIEYAPFEEMTDEEAAEFFRRHAA